MKRAGGRRFYRPQDLAVLRGVRALLHDDGYTIKGVQRLHKEQGIKRLLLAAGQGEDAPQSVQAAEERSFEDGPMEPLAEAASKTQLETPVDAESEQRLRDALG